MSPLINKSNQNNTMGKFKAECRFVIALVCSSIRPAIRKIAIVVLLDYGNFNAEYSTLCLPTPSSRCLNEYRRKTAGGTVIPATDQHPVRTIQELKVASNNLIATETDLRSNHVDHRSVIS